MKLVLVGVVLLSLSAVQKAEAQGFLLNPFFNTTLTSPSGSGGHTQRGFGVAFGKNGKMFSLETEVSYHPKIIDTTQNPAKSKVLTFSESAIIGPTIGHVKGYGAVGFGDLHLNAGKVPKVNPADPQGLAESLSSNYFTINVGGGAMGYVWKNLGIRGDLRYLRAFGFDVDDLEASSNLSLTHFDFWRLNIGMVAKF